jgi:ribonucleoside-diphosphate reductase alpha chain
MAYFPYNNEDYHSTQLPLQLGHILYFQILKIKLKVLHVKLAQEYGEPVWCKGTGMRNTHLLAIAPTVSNSRISGCSAGIEPYPANIYVFNGAKGTFIVKNPELEKVLRKKDTTHSKVWDQIMADDGSVQNLSNNVYLRKKKKYS